MKTEKPKIETRGRKRLVFKKQDSQRVRILSEKFCSDDEIAAVIGCSEMSLRRYFGTLLKEGRARAKTNLRKLQWQSAKGGSITMQIWLGKQVLGQRDSIPDAPEDPQQPINENRVYDTQYGDGTSRIKKHT